MDRTQYEQSVTFIRACAPGAVVDNGIFSKDDTEISNYVKATVMAGTNLSGSSSPQNPSNPAQTDSAESPVPSTDVPSSINPTETPGQPTETPKPDVSDSGKILVAYFSWSGTSEKIAKNIIEQTGADSFRIERQTPYSTDYTETAYGDAKTEADANARPAIKNPLASVSQYEKIVLCYPIWWHTAPMTVGTFLESYDLSGKMIYPVFRSD